MNFKIPYEKMRISELVFPRLVVLITVSDGEDNVATYSFLMPVSFDPKYVAFSIGPLDILLTSLRTTKSSFYM